MKKTILFLLAVMTAFGCLFAQTTKNPFAKLGYKKQVMYTSSKGEFDEFHDKTDVVEIGSVYFNTKTNKVIGYLNDEKENAEVAPATSAMSVDPHCEKYYWISPYAFCLNNPVKFVDPDGKDAVMVVFPDYKISTPIGKIGGLGHAGVLLIDNKTGTTKYYEYGRYDSEGKGMVRNISVSNVEIGKDGKPTTESLNKVMGEISNKAGHDGKIEGAYVKSDEFKSMNDYAKNKMAENKDPNREEYSLTGNNCGTFAADVINQDKNAKKDAPKIIDPRPTSIIKEYQDKYPDVKYDPQKKETTVK